MIWFMIIVRRHISRTSSLMSDSSRIGELLHSQNALTAEEKRVRLTGSASWPHHRVHPLRAHRDEHRSCKGTLFSLRSSLFTGDGWTNFQKFQNNIICSSFGFGISRNFAGVPFSIFISLFSNRSSSRNPPAGICPILRSNLVRYRIHLTI